MYSVHIYIYIHNVTNQILVSINTNMNIPWNIGIIPVSHHPQRPWHLHHQRSAGLTPPRRSRTAAVRRQRANGRAAAGGREAVVKAEALRPGQSVDHVDHGKLQVISMVNIWLIMVNIWLMMVNNNLVGGFNPSEKYESQLGWLFPTKWKNKKMFQNTNQRWYKGNVLWDMYIRLTN